MDPVAVAGGLCRRFNQHPQAIAQTFLLGCFEHFFGGFVSLAGVHEVLRPFFGLVEFAFEQIQPRQPEPRGGRIRRGLE